MLVRNIFDIKYMVVETEQDALLLENNLIKKYQPRYNIRLKDDKSYPWICIKNETFPRVFKTRNLIKDGSKYFGPYTNLYMVKNLLDLFKSQYKLRTCNYNLSKENIEKKKFKVCLEYHIGNCLGPCEGFITEDYYNRGIEEIINILKGNISGVIKYLNQLIEDLSNNLKYEEAKIVKDKYESLTRYQSKSTIVSPSIEDVDVFSIDQNKKYAYVNFLKVVHGAIIQTYTLEIKKSLEETAEELLLTGIVDIRLKILSNAKEILLPFKIDNPYKDVKFNMPVKGDKKKLVDLSTRNAKYFRLEKERQNFNDEAKIRKERILKTLQQDLNLPVIPNVIECFDNSNIQGSNPVAACVVFRNAKPSKRDYRHYNIKTVEGPNDYASMKEVVFRRYRNLIDENKALPQLIIIDGGKGQLSSAIKALDKLNIRDKVSIVSIAKKFEEIFVPGDPNPLYINKNSESLKLIKQLRDEAHRFGITFHRGKRLKSMTSSILFDIEGIGKKSIEKLLTQFKSVTNIKNADLVVLEESLGNHKAKLIYDYFHSDIS
jgi:excinuclease ABC subunit C